MSTTDSPNTGERQHGILFWILFLAGLFLHIYAASRTWIGGDQAHLLRLGASFASDGTIIPFGKLLAGSGTNPGILLQLLFGIPMYLTGDFRSPMIVVILFHLTAFYLVSRVLKQVYGEAVMLPLVIVYWLTPWRILYGSLLWEPAFIYLPAALHFWSCFTLRVDRSWIFSALCTASVVWAMQIHNSFMILALVTFFLLWKKQIRLHWIGAAAGALLAGLTLVPSIIAIVSGNLHYDDQQVQGYIGKGLVTVIPMFKGLLYWFNLGGVEAVRPLKETSFASTTSVLIYALQAVCILTVLFSIFASWKYFRSFRKQEAAVLPAKLWLRNYAVAVIAALVVAAALSPLTLQGWMVVIALHAACIPMVVWSLRVIATRSKWIWGAVGYALFEVAVMLVIILGQSIFQPTDKLPDALDPVRDAQVISYIRH